MSLGVPPSTDLMTVGAISGVMLTFVPRRFPGAKPGHGRGSAVGETSDIHERVDR